MIGEYEICRVEDYASQTEVFAIAGFGVSQARLIGVTLVVGLLGVVLYRLWTRKRRYLPESFYFEDSNDTSTDGDTDD